jgi:hypothetical protein
MLVDIFISPYRLGSGHYLGSGRFLLLCFFLRDSFTANAASPPVEAAPATISPMVAKQNGHIVHLLDGDSGPLSRFYRGDGPRVLISTGQVEKI